MYSETPIQSYYKFLNSGFRPGFAAGTDYRCNGGDNGGALGGLLAYFQVAGGQLNCRNWVEGIASGRTVVSGNGHNEFLDLKVASGDVLAAPGDEIDLAGAGNVTVTSSVDSESELERNDRIGTERTGHFQPAGIGWSQYTSDGDHNGEFCEQWLACSAKDEHQPADRQ
jgi:hypothetical protein